MTPDSGVLSVDQAVAALAPKKGHEEAPAAVVEETTPQPEQTETPKEDTQVATTTEEGIEAEAPGDAEEAEGEEDAEAIRIEPPRWWSHDKKARFKELPPDLQAVVFEQEETRERVVAESKQKAADERKAAEADRAKITERLAILDQLVPQAASTFQGRWANVDWQQLSQQLDPGEYNQLRAKFEAEQSTLVQLAKEHQKADTERFAKFVETEGAKLKEVCPELVDDKLGPQRKQDLGKFLVTLGFPAERINAMSAHEASLAYDAMRWRNAQKQAAALKQAKPQTSPAPQARPTVKPTASSGGRSPNGARGDQLSRQRTLSTDEAVELLGLRNS